MACCEVQKQMLAKPMQLRAAAAAAALQVKISKAHIGRSDGRAKIKVLFVSCSEQDYEHFMRALHMGTPKSTAR